MSDIRLNHLRAYSPSAVEEGQDYWTVGIPDLIEVISVEIAESPTVTAINNATGEVVQGPLMVLLGHMTRWSRDGNDWKVQVGK